MEKHGDGWALFNVDCIEGMNQMPENSVDFSIFSPPFGDLFVYSASERDMGNVRSGAEFQEHYDFFARSLLRVMKPGRVVGVHCSDLPTRKGKHGFIGLEDFSGELIAAHKRAGFIYHSKTTVWKDPVVEMHRTKALGLLYKQVKKDSAICRVGMPDYILWFRKDGENPDRVEHAEPGDTKRALKIAREWLADLKKQGLVAEIPDDAMLAHLVSEAQLDVLEWQKLASPVWMDIDQTDVISGFRDARCSEDERHVCPLQLGIIRRALRIYTKPGDIVMDPFNGVASSGYEAVRKFRKYIGFELKREYFDFSSRLLDSIDRQQSLFAA